MKGTSLIVAVVLSLAVAGLYVLHFTGSSKGSSSANSSQEAAGVPGSKIAYIKVDSLILNYDLAQDLHEEFTRKQEAYTSEYGAKRTVFEREANEFQQKLQRGGFLTEQRAMQERDRLVSKEQEITKLDQELSGKLAEMQQVNNQQLIENLISFLKTYNEVKKFDYILNSSDILIGPESVNITKEVLSQMNARYQATKTAK